MAAKNNYLNKYSKNVFSQYGEDGILEQVFKLIKPAKKEKWCVEFGAWDGVKFSNTRQLIINNGWRSVLIEPNKRRFKELRKNNQDSSAILMNKYVTFEGKDTLDKLLSKTKIPVDFDLLSIDIDGNDYHIWKSVKKYVPKVVVIEFNPTIPPEIEFIQPENMKVNQGSSLLALYKLGEQKGYKLVACTDVNAVFVLKRYFKLFNIEDNFPEKIMPKKYLTYFYQLYDGTIKLEGCKRLLWHGVDFDDKDIQILPKCFRHFSTWHLSILAKLYKRQWNNLSVVFNAEAKTLGMYLTKKKNP
jgi:hypothetical protein